MKNKLLFTFFSCALLLCFNFVNAQPAVELPRNPSPAAEVSQTIGISEVTINYSRPHIVSPQGQDRTDQIWGQLVPYGLSQPFPGFGSGNPFPWRAGANENTIITFSHDAQVEGESLEAGTYGLHMILKEDGGATVIFSNNYSSWGSFFYDESEDALRVDVQTKENHLTPRLTYNFVDIDPNSATVALDWEKKRIPFKVTFDVPEIVFNNLNNELRSTAGFGWQGYNQAANYLQSNNIHLDKALTWADQSIAANENFTNLGTKSQILSKQGKEAEAEEIMNKALDHPTANAPGIYTYGRTLIGQDKDQKALEVFEKLNEKFPDHWLAPHGLARGYSALGDYKKALKYEKIAIEKAPATSKPFLEGFIKTLEEGKDFN